MANICVLMVLFCLLNVIITNLPYLTNASSSCKSNGAHSPAINPHGTRAILTLNDFGRGGGEGPAECDGRFHPLPQRVVALSSGWYNNGKRCGKMIRIKAKNGRSTVARVVDECDSICGGSHKQACKNNVVDASESVWKDLRLNTDDGEIPVTWTIL